MVREEEFQGRPSFFIEGRADSKKVGSNGKSADEGKMRIWLDRERYTLLRMELYDGDVFLNSIENKGFRKFSADIWLPNHVEVKNSTATSLEKATYRLSRMIINEPIAEGTFQMHYAKGVEVMRENTQEGMVPKSVQGKPDFSSSTP
jgi:outer membrane lipoprotein-sorting protein